VPQIDGAPALVTGADVAAAATAARSIAADRRGSYVDQSHAPECQQAHETTTGPEIWKQSGGRVDAWVAAVGTGATFLGVGAALRRRNRHILCAAVEPVGCQPLAGLPIVKRAICCKERAMAACRRTGNRALWTFRCRLLTKMSTAGVGCSQRERAYMSVIRPPPMYAQPPLC
jgi:cysteine synthase